MPDLFHWLLSGEKANEYTDATTTQFYNPLSRRWATELLEKLGLPTHVLGKLVEPGTRLGPLRREVSDATGLSDVDVVLPGTHDTASAVMAVPAAATRQPPDWCYISSGTWSLMGVEWPTPVVTEKCRRLRFTNEGGVGGRTRLLKNISGLWLVQECRRIWNLAGKSYGWEDLNRLAAAAPPLVSLVNPDDTSFLAPPNMPDAIRAFCRNTGQAAPDSDGAVVRSAIESLALRYRQVLAALEDLIGGRIETIHVVGGGTQNRQLCQATADACGRRVVAGPVEATAIGNVMMQAVAAGAVGSIAEAREVIRRSFTVDECEPRGSEAWDAAYERFVALAPL
jgi:rhamnulokinase